MADDIIAIPDITADESERLKQICEVLKHVEDIFSSHVSRHIVHFETALLKWLGIYRTECQHRCVCATLAQVLLCSRNHGTFPNPANQRDFRALTLAFFVWCRMPAWPTSPISSNRVPW